VTLFELELLVNGIITGVFYALMAIGLSMIFGILKIVNFAHGEYYMVGAYAYTLFAAYSGLSPGWACPWRWWPAPSSPSSWNGCSCGRCTRGTPAGA